MTRQGLASFLFTALAAAHNDIDVYEAGIEVQFKDMRSAHVVKDLARKL